MAAVIMTDDEPEVSVPPVVEAHQLAKRYVSNPASVVPIPWLSIPRSGKRDPDDENAALAGALDFDDDDEDDYDYEDEQRRPGTPRGDGAAEDIWALRDVSFNVAPGQVVGVVGEPGAGKSTLIRVLTRVTPPTRGHAIIRGRIAPTIGMAGLFADRSRRGVDAIFRIARFYGIPQSVAEAAVEPIREFTGLGQALEARARTYSSADYQRLIYATSLFLDPDAIIGELLFVGDPEFRARSLRELEDRVSRGLAMLVAPQDMRQVRQLCTHLLWLREGRVEAMGPVDELASAYDATVASKAAKRARATIAETDGAADRDDGPVGIRTAGIYDMEGRPMELPRASDDTLIEFTFSVRDPGQLRSAVTLFRDGEQLMRLTPPTPLELDSPGVYAATVHLPGGALSPGSYEARVAILGREGERKRTLARTTFRFDAMGDEDESEGRRRRLRPRRLPWEVTRLDDPGDPEGQPPRTS